MPTNVAPHQGKPSLPARRLAHGKYEIQRNGWTYTIERDLVRTGDGRGLVRWLASRVHTDGRTEPRWNSGATLREVRGLIASATS